MNIEMMNVSDFYLELDKMGPRLGHLFLDIIEERESLNCLFYDLDLGKRHLYRLPLISKDEIFKTIGEKWPFLLEQSEKSFEKKSTHHEMSLGPYHPFFAGDICSHLTLENEILKKVDFETGFRHLGIESRLLKEGLDQSAFLVNHLGVESSPTSNILWCMGIESLTKTEIPARAKVIRMLFLELARIRSHLFVFKKMSALLGLYILSSRCSQQLLFLRKLFQDYGLSFAHPYLCIPGGLYKDMPDSWPFELKAYLLVLEKFLAVLSKELFSSRFVYERTFLAALESSTALESSVSGPLIRSCGIRWDNRKKNPYYFYDQLDFEIPLGKTGTAYERLLVRHEEMLQSLSILRQIFNFIPAGEMSSEVHLQGSGSTYVALEAPEGELGIYLSFGNSTLQNIKVRSCAEAHLQLLKKHSVGLCLSDFFINFCSYNISTSELDR